MRGRIVAASALLQGRTELSASDYREVLARCGPSDLVYMDPPYQGVCKNRDNRYCPKIDHAGFCDSLAALNGKGCMFVVSYDGRTGSKTYGDPLPKCLNLVHIEVHAGRSTQATLLGRCDDTYESLYLSPALYDHPPRAARDVREQGIPLETFRIAGTEGKSIAAYRFADPSKIQAGILSGRKVFSKEFKETLVARSGSKCGVCLTEFQARYLQVDHRVPYEVGGEGRGESAPDEFQLICGSCNRAKSWSCEHCTNWTQDREVKVCQTCYWASPEAYKHVALLPIRRLDMTWTGDDTREYDRLVKLARKAGQPLPDFVRAALRQRLK